MPKKAANEETHDITARLARIEKRLDDVRRMMDDAGFMRSDEIAADIRARLARGETVEREFIDIFCPELHH